MIQTKLLHGQANYDEHLLKQVTAIDGPEAICTTASTILVSTGYCFPETGIYHVMFGPCSVYATLREQVPNRNVNDNHGTLKVNMCVDLTSKQSKDRYSNFKVQADPC